MRNVFIAIVFLIIAGSICFSAMTPEEIKEGLKNHDRALHIKGGWIRDPFIVLHEDDYYYLTGTTPLPEAEQKKMEKRVSGPGYTMTVWRSKDLIEWENLGVPFTLLDGIWPKVYPDKFKEVPMHEWRLWAPEIYFINGKWIIVHTGPTPVKGANLSITHGPELKGPYDNPMGKAIAKRHDPALFIDDDKSVWMIWNAAFTAKLKPDFSGFATKEYKIGPSDRKIGHEGCYIHKIGNKYVLFGTAWSRDKLRHGTYNLYYCLAGKVNGPYDERKFCGRFLGHGTPFKDREGKWWCTAFYNANKPTISREDARTKDLRDTAYTINKMGTTIVPLDVKILPNGDVRVRAKDPDYASPGKEEMQKFTF